MCRLDGHVRVELHELSVSPICTTNRWQRMQHPTRRDKFKDRMTHVDILNFAALNKPAATYPMTADPTTAPPRAKRANMKSTITAKVKRDRFSFCLAGEREGRRSWLWLLLTSVPRVCRSYRRKGMFSLPAPAFCRDARLLCPL